MNNITRVANLGRSFKLKSRKVKGPTTFIRGKMTVRNKNQKCIYCDKPGIYYKSSIDTWLCEKRAWDCQGYKDYMSTLLIEAQNRKKVKIKKSNSMIELHRGDCEPCKEFQDNYAKGRDIFKDNMYKRNYKFLKSIGIPENNIPIEYKDRKKLVQKIKIDIRQRILKSKMDIIKNPTNIVIKAQLSIN